MPETPPELPLPTPPLSDLGWRVLRVLDEEAGAGWTWAGHPAHLAQKLGAREKHCIAALRELVQRQIVELRKSRRKHEEGALNISLMAVPRTELRAWLRLVTRGPRPITLITRCKAEGLGRARCGLEAGHAGPHVDGKHPALRDGEILSWVDGVT